MAIPKYSLRRVVYTRVELQIINNMGNRLSYVDPEKNNGEIYDRKLQPETIKVLESPRLLTETEAELMGLPFEGERIMQAEPTDGQK
jgi:hypothetical protein